MLFNDNERVDDEESASLLLACYKLAESFSCMGLRRVRFVTQSAQTALRLQHVVLSNKRQKDDPLKRNIRISVLGTKKDSREGGFTSKQMHYGIAADDDIVVMVRPTTERRALGSGGVIEALEDVVAAASSLRKPVAFVNPNLVRQSDFGRTSTYLMASFVNAFEVNAMAYRHSRDVSCALLRRWPNSWECFLHDTKTSQRIGYVYLGKVATKPTQTKLKELVVNATGEVTS
jgi:hypothetical protein